MSKKERKYLGCYTGCRSGCSKIRECEDCFLNAEVGESLREIKNRCCRRCPQLLGILENEAKAIQEGFSPCHKGFYDSRELDGITEIIRLGISYTCSQRAAHAFASMHRLSGIVFEQVGVVSFDEGVEELRKRANAVLLVPHLNDIQKKVEIDHHFRELETQRFSLPNPTLAIARPLNPSSRQRVLFSLPNLLPLVKEAYRGKIPFREIVPTESTTDAAEYCSKIFGGGYCVANEMQFSPFRLKIVRELPRKTVTWRLYANKGKNS